MGDPPTHPPTTTPPEAPSSMEQISLYTEAKFSFYRLVGVRVADSIPATEREICERYGEQRISAMLASGQAPSTQELQSLYLTEDSRQRARDWLTETSDIGEWHSFRGLLLELLIVLMIGLELIIAYQQGKQESQDFKNQQRIEKRNFKEQQRVLKDLLSGSGATAAILENLKKSSSSTAVTLSRQLNDFEAASRATLTVKISPAWPDTLVAPDTPNSEMSIACTIENGGATAATSIRIERDLRLGSALLPRAPKRIGLFNVPIEINTEPNPDDAGPSIYSWQYYYHRR